MSLCRSALVCLLMGASLSLAGAQVAPGPPAAPGALGHVQPESSAAGGTRLRARLPVRIAALLGSPEASAAHWGIAVTTLEGKPVLSWNADQLFRPASTMKLFTTAAAMALLGPTHTVSTTVLGKLDAEGNIAGDLTLSGGGDPSFGTSDLPYGQLASACSPLDSLETVADRLVALGVRRIRGDVVGDDTLFDQEPPPEGWAAEDLVWGYGALPSALSIDDNQLRLHVTADTGSLDPGGGGLSATSHPDALVSLTQRLPWVQLTQAVHTVPAASSEGAHIGVLAQKSSRQTLRVFGTVPAGVPPITEEVALEDPAAYAAAALKQLLVRRGLEIDGDAHAIHLPAEDARPYLAAWRASGQPAASCASPKPAVQPLVSVSSAPLQDEVVFTLKTSANLHAELLLRQLAAQNGCSGASALAGAAILRDWLLQLGIPEHDLVFYDGSGLSAKDLVTPRAEAQLLSFAARQAWFPAWQSALPVGGVDGTLAGRFTAPRLQGRVLAKTGTLGESRALAGYVRCLSGKTLIFSILVDDHEPGSTVDRTAMDAIVAAIAESH